MTGEVGTHLHEDEDNKCDKDVGAGMVPGFQDAQVFELITDPLLGPRLVVKECHQGVLLCELASHELSKAGWEGQRGDDQCHQGREEQALLHEEAIDGLLAAHELHNLAVEVDKECTPEAAGDPDDGKGRQLLQVEGEVEAEAGFEQCRDCLFILVPDSKDTEDEGAEGGSEEATPVVADGKECGGDLDAEEDAYGQGSAGLEWGAPSDGGGEAAANTDSAGSCQHFNVSCLILIEAPEEGEEATEQGCTHAGDVDKGTLLAQGHAAAQGTRQSDHLGHKGFEGEVLLQHDAPQDGLHLGDP